MLVNLFAPAILHPYDRHKHVKSCIIIILRRRSKVHSSLFSYFFCIAYFCTFFALHSVIFSFSGNSVPASKNNDNDNNNNIASFLLNREMTEKSPQLSTSATLRFDSAVQCHLTTRQFCEGGGVRFITASFLDFLYCTA